MSGRIPIRVAVTLLASRVAILSQHIRDAGLEVPEMEKEDHDTLQSILQSLGIGCEVAHAKAHTGKGTAPSVFGNSKAASTTGPALLDQSSISDLQLTTLEDGDDNGSATGNDIPPVYEPPGPDKNTQQATTDTILEQYDIMTDPDNGTEGVNRPHGLPHTHAEEPNPIFSSHTLNSGDPPETDSDDEVTNQLACRLGRVQLTQDGQLRYFGSTSNLTLLDVSVSIDNPNSTFLQKDADEILEDLKLNLEVEEEFERHLLDLYFAWQDPCLHVVHSETFWKAKLQHRYEGFNSPYYSRALCDAM